MSPDGRVRIGSILAVVMAVVGALCLGLGFSYDSTQVTASWPAADGADTAMHQGEHARTTAAASGRGYDDRANDARALTRPSEYRLAPRTTLYRAVSKAELDDVAANGFRASERSMSGKFFAETPEHAAEWGRRLIYGKEGIPFHVVETRVPTSLADRLMRWDKLDGIGPARYVDDFLLDELNRLRSPIVDLPAIPRG